MLTVKQVAERLNVSLSTIYGLVNQGRIRAHRIGTARGSIRITEDALQQYLESSLNDASQASARPHQRRHRSAGLRFKHLDADRLLAAWQQQGVRVDQPDGHSVQPSE